MRTDEDYYLEEQMEERFWGRVDKQGDNGCWNWKGLLSGGYGNLTIKYRVVYAHRRSWELTHGPIPSGKLILHKCDNKKCVNPDHLYVGDHIDNGRDMVARTYPKWRKGENTGTAKLKSEDVLEIRRLALSGVRQVDIGTKFGISQPHVSCIVRRKWWTHI